MGDLFHVGSLSSDLDNEYVQRFFDAFSEVLVYPEGAILQTFLRERGLGPTDSISAVGLSDGTLRLLCLLVILLNPAPPPLICIEEPEAGLHPDAIRIVAELLVRASERTQLIVTTHSPALVDALSDRPESIVVCERGLSSSSLTSLSASRSTSAAERQTSRPRKLGMMQKLHLLLQPSATLRYA